MKIAVPSDEGRYLSQHFGRTLGFSIFEVTNGQIVNQIYRPNTFTGHALGLHYEHQHHGADNDDHTRHSHGSILSALNDCEIVIAGGMGQRLYIDLTGAGKKVFITTQRETRKAVEMFLADELSSDKEACEHHE